MQTNTMKTDTMKTDTMNEKYGMFGIRFSGHSEKELLKAAISNGENLASRISDEKLAKLGKFLLCHFYFVDAKATIHSDDASRKLANVLLTVLQGGGIDICRCTNEQYEKLMEVEHD